MFVFILFQMYLHAQADYMARIAHPFLDPVSIRCDVCLYYIEHSQGGVMFVIKCQRRLPLKQMHD